MKKRREVQPPPTTPTEAADLDSQSRPTLSHATISEAALVESVTIPVIEERAQVTKRSIDRGTVRVTKSVAEREEELHTPIDHDEVEIEHVARGTWLDAPAQTRQEGDTTIIPVMEEVVVVEKRIFLREEIYIRKRNVTTESVDRVVLRTESISIEDERDRKI